LVLLYEFSLFPLSGAEYPEGESTLLWFTLPEELPLKLLIVFPELPRFTAARPELVLLLILPELTVLLLLLEPEPTLSDTLLLLYEGLVFIRGLL
jgi:hypothetical protein